MAFTIESFTGDEFHERLLADLKFTPENINQAFIDQTAKFAFWATLAAQAKNLVKTKELEVNQQEDYVKKTVFAKLDVRVRREFIAEGIKATEARITNEILSHEEYQAEMLKLIQLRKDLDVLQSKYNLLLVAKEALIQRKDMIISLGANLRQENNNIEP